MFERAAVRINVSTPGSLLPRIRKPNQLIEEIDMTTNSTAIKSNLGRLMMVCAFGWMADALLMSGTIVMVVLFTPLI